MHNAMHVGVPNMNLKLWYQIEFVRQMMQYSEYDRTFAGIAINCQSQNSFFKVKSY